MKSEHIFFKYLRNLRGKQLLLLLCAAGVLLLLLGNSLLTKKGTVASGKEETDIKQYRVMLEEALATLCASVEGVGEVRVMVMLAEGERRTYSGSNLLSCEMPTVLGVAVVCQGGGDDCVRSELTELLSSLLGIGSHRIHISQMKSA